jgi:hypothetical protein
LGPSQAKAVHSHVYVLYVPCTSLLVRSTDRYVLSRLGGTLL